MTARVYVALSTAPDAEVAGRLARTLVEERWAACVNVVPGVVSHYRWQGRVHQDAEVLLIIKTSSDRIEGLIRRLGEAHPYDVPEVVAYPVERGNPDYLEWVMDSVSIPGE